MTYEQYNFNLISFNVFIKRSNTEHFYANKATGKDDDANANHLYFWRQQVIKRMMCGTNLFRVHNLL